MPIAVTAIGTAIGTTTPLTISVPVGGVPSGALIVVVESGPNSSAATVTSITDSASNSYNAPAISVGINNNATSFGSITLSYAYNVAALVSGNSISIAFGVSSSNRAVSAFYATGIATAADPIDTGTKQTAGGSSLTPSVLMLAAPAVASSLCVGVVGQDGPSGDTFGQDTTHAAWAVPPTRIGTTGGSASGNSTIAGGTVVSSSQLTYAPALGTSRNWGAIIVAFSPPSAAPSAPRNLMSTGFGTAIALEGARRILRNKPQTRREFITPWEN